MSEAKSARDQETCSSCLGSGEAPTEFGIVDCPDCGGVGTLPPAAVRVEWRARDIQRTVQSGHAVEPEHVRWLLSELNKTRAALTELMTLAQDAEEQDRLAQRVRYTANKALGVYHMRSISE